MAGEVVLREDEDPVRPLGRCSSDGCAQNEVVKELVVAGAGAASSTWEAGSAERRTEEAEVNMPKAKAWLPFLS